MTDTAPRTDWPPGLYPGITRAEYDRIPAASQTVLKKFKRTPAHARAAMDHPTEPNDAMRLGTLIHAALLEPKRFASRYVVTGDLTEGCRNADGSPSRNPKATADYKARVQKFAQENVGKLFIDAAEKAVCDAVGEAIAAHTTAATLLTAPGESELGVVWRDPETGTLCKGLIDRLVTLDGRRIAIDLKTTEDASPGSFARACSNYGHHIQSVFYMFGLKTVSAPVDSFVHVVCETDPPFAVATYEIDDAGLDEGYRQMREYLDSYAECNRVARWPGYPDSVQAISIPKWAMTRTGLE